MRFPPAKQSVQVFGVVSMKTFLLVVFLIVLLAAIAGIRGRTRHAAEAKGSPPPDIFEAGDIKVTRHPDNSCVVDVAGQWDLLFTHAEAIEWHRKLAPPRSSECACDCPRRDELVEGKLLFPTDGATFYFRENGAVLFGFDKSAGVKLHALMRPGHCPCGCSSGGAVAVHVRTPAR